MLHGCDETYVRLTKRKLLVAKKPETNSLLESLIQKGPKRNGVTIDWLDRLLVAHPALAADVIAILEQWRDGGKLKEVFQTPTSLAEELASLPGMKVGVQTICKALRGVSDGSFNIYRK